MLRLRFPAALLSVSIEWSRGVGKPEKAKLENGTRMCMKAFSSQCLHDAFSECKEDFSRSLSRTHTRFLLAPSSKNRPLASTIQFFCGRKNTRKHSSVTQLPRCRTDVKTVRRALGKLRWTEPYATYCAIRSDNKSWDRVAFRQLPSP